LRQILATAKGKARTSITAWTTHPHLLLTEDTMNSPCRRTILALVIAFLVALPSFAVDANWPQWRGPRGDGHSTETGVPAKWNARSVVWRTALPGRGQSSPVVWGERIFLTTALENGKQRLVFCVDRKAGKVLWERVVWKGIPEKSHGMNGWATPTCATDGERVYAFFGRGGLHAFTVDGKPVWSLDLGTFEGPWGTAASPVLVGDLLVQNCDAEKEAYLLAVDRRTGKTVWKTPREVPQRGGWSTPVPVQAGTRQELVLNGAKAVTAYDPATGKPLWSCKSFNGRGEPTATPGRGLVFMVNGLRGDIYAVRPGGKGDVTGSHMAWHTPRRGGRDQPSPIVVGNYLVVADMTGITTCYETNSGKILWKERLEGKFTASPIAAGGRVYFLNEAGVVYVLEPGPTFKLISRNDLEAPGAEIFRASLTPSAGQIFIRSDRALYCIGAETRGK
jgi:outer membrane protein assembly factor BamB